MGWQTQVAVQLQAGNTIINPDGSFTYSTAGPGAGTLIATVTPAAGVDSFGNNYLESVTSYGPGNATQIDQGQINLYTGSLAAGWTSQANITITGSVIELITAGGVITSNNTLDNGAGGATFNGNVTISGTASINGSGNTGTSGLANGQINGTSGAQSAGTAHTHGGGSYAVTSGQHNHVL
jgi:hypothetical protein